MIFGAVAAVCGIATVLFRRWAGLERGFIEAEYIGSIVTLSAVIGALVLPWFLAPRRRGWLMPALGALVVPLLSIPLASIPEAVILVSGGEDPFEVVFFMVLMSVFGLWVAWPVFLCGTLLLNAAFRRQLRHG